MSTRTNIYRRVFLATPWFSIGMVEETLIQLNARVADASSQVAWLGASWWVAGAFFEQIAWCVDSPKGVYRAVYSGAPAPSSTAPTNSTLIVYESAVGRRRQVNICNFLTFCFCNCPPPSRVWSPANTHGRVPRYSGAVVNVIVASRLPSLVDSTVPARRLPAVRAYSLWRSLCTINFRKLSECIGWKR